MLADALAYPARGERGLARLALVGVLVAFGWLVLPGLVALGYYVRVLAAASRGRETLPALDGVAALALDGARALVVVGLYAVIPFFTYGVLVFPFGLLARQDLRGTVPAAEPALALADPLLAAVELLLSLLFLLGIYYAVPAALTNVAREGRVRAALDREALKPVLLDERYLVAVVAATVLSAGVWFVAVFLAAVTLGLGVLAFPLVAAWLAAVVAHVFGSTFRAATATERRRSRYVGPAA